MKDKKQYSAEATSRHASDDYKVNFSRRSIIIIAVVSLVFAFLIWVIAVATDSAIHNYTDVTIEVMNASHITDAGYEIVLETGTVSFRVQGRTSVINSLAENSVVPYIDLSDVTITGERTKVPVQFKSEYDLMYSNISADVIYIQIVDQTE